MASGFTRVKSTFAFIATVARMIISGVRGYSSLSHLNYCLKALLNLTTTYSCWVVNSYY